jgi:signal transduction histidine kinase/DNA-binding response OmpR family regulator
MARILLVDDDADGRLAVAETLRRLTDHEVDEASSGPSAVAAARARPYDLVILDARTAGREDYEVCRRLRADERTRRTPLLFLGGAPAAAGRQGFELGPDDGVERTGASRELLARVRAMLRSARPIVDDLGRASRELRRRATENAIDARTPVDDVRAERDILRETFDVFEEGMCLVGADGALEVANTSGRRLYATALREELDATAREAVERGATADRSLLHEGRAYAVRAYPLSGRRAVLYVRDATEERDREIRRLQAEKLASIGMLAAGVAHEINNPTAFVLANIEALAGHMRLVDERIRELPEGTAARLGLAEVLFEAAAILQESKEGMARIHRIVRDLGSFSHVDDDTAAPTNVNVAVESALTMLRNEIKYRARIERDLRATRAVHGNTARLGQVFLNIILNAAQALDEAGVKRNVVRISSFDDGESVVVEIEDNGPGIPADVIPRIFDSFFTTKPRGIGTGLGLPISLGIVRSLGGEIAVESVWGQGATFRVRLPAVDSGVPMAIPPSEVTPAPRVYTRRRILAVDDEALLLKAYRRMLSDIHEVVTALGGHEALRTLEREGPFDVILCDLQMPEMSGMDLHAAVQARFPELADRFIFVTGGAFSIDAKRFIEEAVCGVIQKPFRVEDLLALVDRKARGPGAEGRRSHSGAILASPVS